MNAQVGQFWYYRPQRNGASYGKVVAVGPGGIVLRACGRTTSIKERDLIALML